MSTTESTAATAAAVPTRRTLLIALATSVAGTVVLGGGLYFLLAHNVWWVALGSVPSLLAGGLYLGWKVVEPEPLYGSILSFLYFAIVSLILFGSTWAGKLPDPMPGLATGDSTFFFVWPLLMLAAGVAGSIIGGRLAVARLKDKS
jgi:hypothetical protein